MKILNLVNIERSDIKYQVSQFPDGQQQVTILNVRSLYYNDGEYVYSIKIKSRLNDFKDLELIICAVASLGELGVKDIELYIPYFLGSRSDRKFEEGSNNYLKTVICPIINNLGFTKVTVLDPHSDVLEACLNNFNSNTNKTLTEWTLYRIISNAENSYKGINKYINENCVLVSPDAGANKKIYKLAEEIGYKGEIITCSKSRDNEGKLSGPYIPNFVESNWNKDFVIIDDICDGGRTFINIAKSLKNKCPLKFKLPKIYLIVTHGIFSAGYEELNKYFDGIYCTNSYSDVPDYYDNGMQRFKTNVEQLNIF